MKLGMLGYAPFPFHPRKWMLFFGLIDSILTGRRLQRPQCLITAPIRRSIRICEPSAPQNRCSLSSACLFLPYNILPYNKLSLFHPSTVSATSSNMLHRTYSSLPSQEYKRSFKHVSTQNLSTSSLYRSESKQKHALAPVRPFGISTSSQGPSSKPNDEYSSTPRCTSRLSMSEETTTLEKIWGSLFDEGGEPTTRLGQLLRGLAMHIVRLGS